MPATVSEKQNVAKAKGDRQWFMFMRKFQFRATPRPSETEKQLFFSFSDPPLASQWYADAPDSRLCKRTLDHHRHNWSQKQFLIWDLLIEPLTKKRHRLGQRIAILSMLRRFG